MAYRSLAETFLRTLELRSGGIITDSEIRALRLYFNRMSHVAPGTNRSPWDEDTTEQWDDLHNTLPMEVEPEARDRGHLYISKLLLKDDGSFRNTKLTGTLNGAARHAMARHCLLRMDRIEFHGFEPFGQHKTTHHPIYCIRSVDNLHFKYIAVPWQSGGISFP